MLPNRATHHIYSYSSCAKDFFACAGEYLLKMQSKTLRRKLLSPWFSNQRPWSFPIELNSVEINQLSCHVIRIWVQIRKMHTSKLTESLILSSFIITLPAGANYQFMQLVNLQISVWVYTHRLSSKKVCTGTFMNDPYRFSHLKQPCNSYILKIYQKHLFLRGKTENFKIILVNKMWLF